MSEKRYTRRRLLKKAGILFTGTLLIAEGCSDAPANTTTGTSTQISNPSPATPSLSPATSLPATTATVVTTPNLAPTAFPTPAGPTATPAPTATPTFPLNRLEFPVKPYISRKEQLEPLFNDPAQSFYLQPWRGFLETNPASQFLAGIGINYNLPDNADDAAVLGLLVASGFKAIRLEISWDKVPWEEDRLNNQDRLNTILGLCKKYNITPLILLNANQGAPCPYQSYKREVVAGANKGSRSLTLDSLTDLVAGYSGLSTEGWMAEVLFTEFNQATRTVRLSKPLPMDIASGTQVHVQTLKYLPLYPVDTPQFEETIKGWLKYVQLVLNLVRQNNITNYEIEIWNELTFGSQYLSINNYYDPPLHNKEVDSLFAGGENWELAKRTVDFIRQNSPGVKSIWGYSNVTFFHTPIEKLPAGIGGQSYHPYGTQRQSIPQDFPPKERYDWFIEKFIPKNLTWCMPEGWAHLGVKTETLMKLLNPEARKTELPPGATSFAHYMTEHGFIPAEAGITDKKAAQAHKAKSLIRSVLFWLSKGMSKMYIYSAYQDSDLAQGMLLEQPDPANYGKFAAEELMSPALRALKNMVDLFSQGQTSTELQTRQLEVEVSGLDAQYKVFEGDATHPALYYQDMLCVLPFQASPSRFIIAYYVMSYDITLPLPAMNIKITLKNIRGAEPQVLLFDPIVNKYFLSQKIEFLDQGVAINAEAKDYPLLIVIDES